ncbi:MAG: desulfoferrodoxin [Patescibacteria group bacterium]|nr:desulfoferrodoxin [Patescibacteria group bacterium]
MTKLNEVYKCNVCGNIVEMVHTGVGQLVCCGQPMVLQNPNTVDAAKEKSSDAKAMEEKHAPVIEKTNKDVETHNHASVQKIKIGSVPHPMEEAHYIEWIEIIADGESHKKFLKPGDKPEAEFCVEAGDIKARAYCNLHGLWQA